MEIFWQNKYKISKVVTWNAKGWKFSEIMKTFLFDWLFFGNISFRISLLLEFSTCSIPFAFLHQLNIYLKSFSFFILLLFSPSCVDQLKAIANTLTKRQRKLFLPISLIPIYVFILFFPCLTLLINFS